jgi:intracellular septation protein A
MSGTGQGPAPRRRIGDLLRFLVGEFAPLLLFYALLALFGLKPAIGGSIAFILLDVARHRLRHIAFTRIYMLSAGLTVAFGLIDLSVQTPFMLSYESVVTSLVVGAFFAAGARGERPMLQEMAERSEGEAFPVRPDVTRFFRLLTLFWAAYFVVKAAAYFWLAREFPIGEAGAIRAVAGPASLGVMMLISLQGRRLFRLCRWLGLLPAPATPPA